MRTWLVLVRRSHTGVAHAGWSGLARNARTSFASLFRKRRARRQSRLAGGLSSRSSDGATGVTTVPDAGEVGTSQSEYGHIRAWGELVGLPMLCGSAAKILLLKEAEMKLLCLRFELATTRRGFSCTRFHPQRDLEEVSREELCCGQP
jgi:hypothetical protein